MTKGISFNIAARKKMEAGVNKLADTVKITPIQENMELTEKGNVRR